MPYAYIEESKIGHWYYEPQDDMELVEFTNEEEILALMEQGAKTFVIENSLAVWQPTDEEREEVEANQAQAKIKQAQEEFIQNGNDRLTEVESANLDQDELLVDIADTVTQNQLDTDEALTTLYELMTGETNE